MARGLLALLIALSLGSIYISVLVNRWNAAFYNALQRFDAAEFFRQLVIFLLLTIANVVCAVYQVYLSQMLQIRWRRWLTESFLAAWLKDQSYYRGGLRGLASENPDQRISEDLGLFVVYTLSMSLGVLSSVVTLASFIVILWRLSGSLVIPFGPVGAVTISGYLVWAALLYASIGTWLAMRIGEPLVRINFDLQRHEADFRLQMARFQEHAESIALTRGEASEQLRFRTTFTDVLRNSWAMMRRQKRLTWFTWSYGQVALVFPILVAAPKYFAREIMLGGLMQTAQAFTQVQGALSFILNSYPDIARWRAAVDRLVGFQAALHQAGGVPEATAGIQIVRSNAAGLYVDNLDLNLPNGEPLLRALSFAVRPGGSLLIAGPIGSGKTTLLRAIAGVWPFGRGRVQLPAGTREVIVPEKPYLPIGTLREALIYPQLDSRLAGNGTAMHWNKDQIGRAQHAGLPEPAPQRRIITAPGDGLPTDAGIERALARCGIAHLATRLDEEQNWSQRLSLNEQKRLIFARLLLQRADIIFLDETTSGLDQQAEARLYRVLREEFPNAMLITVGQRATLHQLHEEHLELQRTASGLVQASAGATSRTNEGQTCAPAAAEGADSYEPV